MAGCGCLSRPFPSCGYFKCARAPLRLAIAEDAPAGIGFRVWRAALILCRYLEQEESVGGGPVRGRSVLELGSGAGLVGLLCAHLGAAAVTLSDQETVLPITRHNAELNRPSLATGAVVRVQEVHWGRDVRRVLPRGSFDLIVGSDLTFFEHLHRQLLLTLLQIISEDTEVLLAHARRKREFDRWEAVFEPYFDIEAISTDDELRASGALKESPEGVWGTTLCSAEERVPVTIFRLRLRGLPPSHAELSGLLGAEQDESCEAILTRLALLESDLDTIEAEGSEDPGPACVPGSSAERAQSVG
uniref:Calmodulin-lysine N-methyltransferase n=1 Tax=Alexandrium monilatum TaxID=311494 RepID=A0A7S4Q5D6_9DINO